MEDVYTIRKIFKWEASHRLENCYSTNCKYLHGHSYKAEIIISCGELDKNGMVIDFGQLKDLVHTTFRRMDHCSMLKDSDPLIDIEDKYFPIVKVDFNPTAENMARMLYKKIWPLITDEIKQFKKLIVRVHETDTGYAEYTTK